MTFLIILGILAFIFLILTVVALTSYLGGEAFLYFAFLVLCVWGMVALGRAAAPPEQVTLYLVPFEDGHYVVDLRPTGGEVLVKVVHDGETANEIRVVSISKPIRIEETTQPPTVTLPRRTPNGSFQAGTPRVGPILLRVPKDAVWRFDPGPYMEYGKWLY